MEKGCGSGNRFPNAVVTTMIAGHAGIVVETGPLGTTTVIDRSETLVTAPPANPAKATVMGSAPGMKPRPVMVTTVPAGPASGLKLVMTGTGGGWIEFN